LAHRWHPGLAGMMLATPWLLSVPFYLAGARRIAYDLILYRQFVNLPPPEDAA
jgi:hypothetical protein